MLLLMSLSSEITAADMCVCVCVSQSASHYLLPLLRKTIGSMETSVSHTFLYEAEPPHPEHGWPCCHLTGYELSAQTNPSTQKNIAADTVSLHLPTD